MSKKIARGSLCALGMAILTAQAAEPPASLDKGEGRLDIIAWPGYIERGQTDKNYDWVTQFEKRRARYWVTKVAKPMATTSSLKLHSGKRR